MSRPSQKPVLFFHVQHLLGIGHQMRAAALARACCARGFDLHYVSGGFPDREFGLDTATYHQLPPTRVKNADFANLVDDGDRPVDDAWWEKRVTATLSLFDRLQPDILLLEGFPFARRKFGRELLPLIDKARRRGVPVVTSLRDILVTPSKEDKRRKALEIAQDALDAVLVHGDPALVRLEQSFPGVENLGARLYYTGYVDGGAPVQPGTERSSGEVVVSVGGGAVGEALIETALAAQAIFSETDDRPWRLLLGPNLPENYVQDLKSKVLDKNIIIESARTDFREILAKAAASVSQAGYNTVMDILAARCPAVLIPFARGGENEQSLRATLLAEHGLAQVLAEDRCDGRDLARAIGRAVASGSPTAFPYALTGADASATLLYKMVQRNRGRL